MPRSPARRSATTLRLLIRRLPVKQPDHEVGVCDSLDGAVAEGTVLVINESHGTLPVLPLLVEAEHPVASATVAADRPPAALAKPAVLEHEESSNAAEEVEEDGAR